MKAIISDIEILKNLEPNKVATYLHQKGWIENLGRSQPSINMD